MGGRCGHLQVHQWQVRPGCRWSSALDLPGCMWTTPRGYDNKQVACGLELIWVCLDRLKPFKTCPKIRRQLVPTPLLGSFWRCVTCSLGKRLLSFGPRLTSHFCIV